MSIKRLTPEQCEELAARVARVAAPVFRAQDWRWGQPGMVPSEQHIANRLLELMKATDNERTVGTGRLYVTRFIEDDEEVCQIDLQLGDTR